MDRARLRPGVRSAALAVVAVGVLSLGACGADEPAPGPDGGPSTGTSSTPPSPDSGGDTGDHAAVNAEIERLLGDSGAYEQVAEELQRAVAAKDAEAVARLVDYPLTVRLDQDETTIEDADDFVRRYDTILTPDLAGKIGAQNYADLSVDQEGVRFDGDVAMLNLVCDDSACERSEVRLVALKPGT